MEKLAPLDRFTALDVAGSAVAEAGRLLLELSRKPIEVLCEPGHDIKLRADQLAEERILAVLNDRLPLPVLTEESGEHGAVTETSRMWIVDPLDGTFNYSRGMPMCCSSVGLWENGQPVLGAVYNFFNDELFAGIVGQGAWLNGKPIAVSNVKTAAKASLATGFPHHQSYDDAPLRALIEANTRDGAATGVDASHAGTARARARRARGLARRRRVARAPRRQRPM